MRRMALLLVLTLIAPALAGALCDLTCVESHARAMHRGGECHGQQTTQVGRGLKAAGSLFCHNTGDEPDATLTSTPLQSAAPLAVLPVPPTPERRVIAADSVADRSSWRPPDLLLITTQLRI